MFVATLKGSVAFILVVAIGCSSNGVQKRLNQEHARSSLMKIKNAQMAFKAKNQSGAYGTLEDLSAAKLIEPALATGKYKGYLFKVRLKDASFEAVATPVSYGNTGYWSFYVNNLGVIHGAMKNGQEATTNDPPIKSDE